jgi:hypothetical protein
MPFGGVIHGSNPCAVAILGFPRKTALVKGLRGCFWFTGKPLNGSPKSPQTPKRPKFSGTVPVFCVTVMQQ